LNRFPGNCAFDVAAWCENVADVGFVVPDLIRRRRTVLGRVDDDELFQVAEAKSQS